MARKKHTVEQIISKLRETLFDLNLAGLSASPSTGEGRREAHREQEENQRRRGNFSHYHRCNRSSFSSETILSFLIRIFLMVSLCSSASTTFSGKIAFAAGASGMAAAVKR